MMLNMIVTGTDTNQPPVLLAHGLFGSGKNLGGLARRLAETRRVISVEMRNHGDSFHDPDHSYPALAGDLAEVIAANGGQADVLGHSMGGKAAMMLALTHPGAVRRLVVADIAPTAYAHSQNHLVDAMRGMDLSNLTLRSEADRRLASEVSEEGTRAFLLQSLDLKADPVRWRLNLDLLHAEMDKITGWPDTDRQYTGPALFLSGSNSRYVRDEHHARITALFPKARFQQIEGAGHWLHAERPREFEAALRDFLD